jgi:hypothetical protein
MYGREMKRTESPLNLMPQVSRTEVSELFFSEMNIDALQHGIRYGVFRRSEGKLVIGEQSRDELLTVMRSIYLSEGRNLPYEVVPQVRKLNSEVLGFCVPRVEREAYQYLKYRVDSSTQPRPLPYGEFTSRAGLRSSSERFE